MELTGLCLMWLIEVGFSGGNTNRSMFNVVTRIRIQCR